MLQRKGHSNDRSRHVLTFEGTNYNDFDEWEISESSLGLANAGQSIVRGELTWDTSVDEIVLWNIFPVLGTFCFITCAAVFCFSNDLENDMIAWVSGTTLKSLLVMTVGFCLTPQAWNV